MRRFASLENLGLRVAAMSSKTNGDASNPPDRNAFCAACGVDPSALRTLRQVHGNSVLDAVTVTPGAKSIEADGLVTNRPGVPMAVWVADCVPLFLVDPKIPAAGIIHAGREGTRKAIALRAVEKLRELGALPERIHALIGPSAGPCCYEVSGEMAGEFRAAGLPARGRHLDLWEANAQQLRAAGLPAGNITIDGACTICSGEFHSCRADQTLARNAALVLI